GDVRRFVAGERERGRDGVEDQLRDLARGCFPLGEVRPERAEQCARERLLRRGHPAIILPARKVIAAAMAPTSTVSRPLRSHGRPVMRVFAAPATNSATSVQPTESPNAVGTAMGTA